MTDNHKVVSTGPWRVHKVQGFTMTHPWIATAPGCPQERHPTRDCKCKVFRSLKAAEAYVGEQS